MKKNKLMRIASVLLVATLLSTSVISGTFAKYVTTDAAQDAARVARFGVLVSAEGILFGDSYSQNPGDSIQAATDNHTVTVTAHNTANGQMGNKLIAPGTKNTDGMTFSVKGTPEVSTKLHIDMPEGTKGDDNKPYANSDVYLEPGAYYIMQKLLADDIVITKDNRASYYKLDGESFKALTADPSTGDIVYKAVQLTGVQSNAYVTGSEMTARYYPIQWYLDGAALPAADNNVVGLYTALVADLGGDGAQHTPNTPWDATSTITWSWLFTDGDVWTNITTGEAMDNWENTTLRDLEDTVLGQMIARYGMTSNTETYEMAIMSNNILTKINYTVVAAADGSANTVIVAYTGNSVPNSLDQDNAPIIACLTVSFGARITVEQVD